MIDEVDLIIKFEAGELPIEGVLQLFSSLIKSGKAYTLQGSYGRYTRNLISEGYLSEDGTILQKED